MSRVVPRLLERGPELAALDGAVRGGRAGSGRLVVIQGPAGIGKTSLLHAAVTGAEASGTRVLTARATRLERAFGFGVARQLFEELARDVTDGPEWPAATRAAVSDASVPLGAAPSTTAQPKDPRDAAFTAEHSLLRLVVELAREEPLVLVVDDAQWADESSLRVLALIAGHLGKLGVTEIVAVRQTEEPVAGSGVALVTGAVGVTLLRPSPLSDAAAARLVRTVAADASAEECSRCQTATRGNPLFLYELAKALRASGAAGLQEVPPSVIDAVTRRLSPLSDHARALAQAVAILEPRASLARCADLSAQNWDVAVAAADELYAASIVEHGAALVFVHPVVRDAVRDAIAPARRADLHASAAALLQADGVDPDVIVSHLLRSPPRGDPAAVAQLQAAAQTAVERGAPEAAITYLRRAVDEPPPVGPLRTRLLLWLGQTEMLWGSIPEAEADLRRALRAADSATPAMRLEAAMALGQLLSVGDRLREGVLLLDAELQRAESVDPELCGQAEALVLNLARMDSDANAAVAERGQRLRRHVIAGGSAAPAQLAAVAAAEAQSGGSAVQTADVALRSLRGLRLRPEVDVISCGFAARALIAADRLNESIAALEQALDAVRRSGSRFHATFLVAMLGEARYRSGALADAERLALIAVDSAGEWQVGRPAMVSLLARAQMEQGNVDGAGQTIASVDLDSADAAPSWRYPLVMALHARGRWRLTAGDPTGALMDFESCGARLEACGEPSPALIEWRSDAAWALVAVGRTKQARVLAEEELALARAFGAPRSIGIALRACAALSMADERGPLLREALATLERSPARLARAQVLADLGLHLGRDPEARDHLAAALELADDSGARPLSGRLRRALARTGARPRRSARTGPAALTAAERRVARLAAEGLTNRAIAERLVVTVRTVEMHLTHSYRKLGIASRASIARALKDAG